MTDHDMKIFHNKTPEGEYDLLRVFEIVKDMMLLGVRFYKHRGEKETEIILKFGVTNEAMEEMTK